MAPTYDLKNDIRFKQGKQENAKTTIEKMLLANVSLNHTQIADFFDVPLEFVKKIADSLKK